MRHSPFSRWQQLPRPVKTLLGSKNRLAFCPTIDVSTSVEWIGQYIARAVQAEFIPLEAAMPGAFAAREQQAILMEVVHDVTQAATQSKALEKQTDCILHLLIRIKLDANMRHKDQTDRYVDAQLATLGFAQFVLAQTLVH